MSRPGAGLDLDVSHRRLIDVGSQIRPMDDGLLFERIGGQSTVDRLVDVLYDRFEDDAMIRPFFGRDLAKGRARQKRFFAEWLGGPERYSESAWGGLHQHHEDLPITEAAAVRWLDHLHAAAIAVVANTDDAERVVERARRVALALVNTRVEQGGSPPGPGQHRSTTVASCGVAGRTVALASRLAQRGRRDELAALVDEVPDLVQRVRFAAGLVQDATTAGRVQVVEWLLDRGASANAPAPLPVSVVGGAMELVCLVTPRCAAQSSGHWETDALLEGRGGRGDVFTAAFVGDVATLEPLVAEHPSVAHMSDPATDVVTITPVHHAVAGRQMASLRMLLDHSTEPVPAGGRALRAASARGSVPMVELLLDHGADARAVGAGRWVLNPDLATRLANAGAAAGVGTDGEDSGDWIRISCTGNRGRKDDPAFVTALLDHGARVDHRYNGATPLHYAAKAGFVQTIEVLLDHGGDRHALDDHGRSPLDWLNKAVKSVDKDAVRSALEHAPRRSA
jgi:truncated hemoglobin YjbI